MISMLRHAAKSEPGRPVTFLYTVRAEPDVAFRDELAVLARRAPGVRVYVTLSRGEPKPGFLTGRMDPQKIARYVPDPAKAIHLICGPAPMIASLREGLASLGVPEDRIPVSYTHLTLPTSDLGAISVVAVPLKNTTHKE